MTKPELKARVVAVSTSRHYCQTKGETREKYARRLAAIIYRGWSFIGVAVETHEQRVIEIQGILAELV